MNWYHMAFYNIYPIIITHFQYYLSYCFTVLPVDSFSPILRCEDNLVLT